MKARRVVGGVAGVVLTLVAAFCPGMGMQRSGLLKRLSMAILGRFPHTFRAQANGLFLALFTTIRNLVRHCVIYMLICLVALLASVPYWRMLGLA